MPHIIDRARTIVLAAKVVSRPAVRIGNHSFIMSHNVYRARTRRSDFF